MRRSRDNMKFFEDLTRMATGALGSFTEIRRQVKSMVREGMDQVMGEMDLVTRKEFERVEKMAQRARERQEELEARLAKLEKGSPKKTTRKQPAKKKTTAARRKKK